MIKEKVLNLQKILESNVPQKFQAVKLPEYNCKKCKDMYYTIFKDENGKTFSKECECLKKVVSEERFRKTELYSKKELYTFKNYIATEDWQKNILKTAKDFCKNQEGWFFIGGQVGSGKTHICTAILRNMSEIYNLSFEYMLFNKQMTFLKSIKFDNKDKYEDLINKYYNIDILFIDDLFKTIPTNADLDMLFDIINNRYLQNKICIISSEKFLSEIITIDEAIGSRILEKSVVVEIGRDEKRNYRLI